MIYKMVMELKHGQMDQNMKEITKKERNMDKVLTLGVINLNMLENGLKIGKSIKVIKSLF